MDENTLSRLSDEELMLDIEDMEDTPYVREMFIRLRGRLIVLDHRLDKLESLIGLGCE